MALDTHVVGLQIGVILFKSVVQYGYHNSFARVAHIPGGHYVEIEAVLGAAVLQ